MDINQYFLFFSVAFLYIVSPGPAVFISINYGATQGIKKTMALLAGNTTGLAILASVSALGIGLIVVNSAELLNVVKIVGSAVLFYLGIKMLIAANSARRQQKEGHAKLDTKVLVAPIVRSHLSLYKEGLLLALTNPKPLIFFSAIFPQFLNGTEGSVSNMVILGATFVSLSFICMNLYAVFGNTVFKHLLKERGLMVLNALSGLLFIAMAGTMALADIRPKR